MDVGVEYNPRAKQASPLMNVRVLHETRTRHGLSVLLVRSKDLGVSQNVRF